MMAMQLEAKRVKTGQSLADFEQRGQQLVSGLTQLKAGLLALKTAVNSDVDFDATDEAEVQVVIDALVSDIQALLP